MEITTLNQIKKELKSLSHDDILLLCLRLGKFKKENKEIMQYLLMDAHDEEGYVSALAGVVSSKPLELIIYA